LVEPRSAPLLSDNLSFLTFSESFSYLNPKKDVGINVDGFGKIEASFPMVLAYWFGWNLQIVPSKSGKYIGFRRTKRKQNTVTKHFLPTLIP
jgi:ATP/ADP translocase